MKVKVSTAEGPVLDYMVAVAANRWNTYIRDDARLGTSMLDIGADTAGKLKVYVPRKRSIVREEAGSWPGMAPAPYADWSPSTDPAQAWPIIEREGLRWNKIGDQYYVWTPDHDWYDPLHEPMFDDDGVKWRGFEYGPTGLIAAMRCYVASKLGYEVDVPEELFK